MTLCPKCGNSNFKGEVKPIENITNTIALIVCKACGCVVSAIDITTSDNIKEIMKRLK
jgi:uncharacterized Zn finger protein